MQEILERLFFLQQVGNTIAAEVRLLIGALFEGVERDMRRLDPTSVQSRYRIGRRDALVLRVRDRVRSVLPEWRSQVQGQLARLGRQQAVMVRRSLIATLGTVIDDELAVEVPITEQRMRAILNTEPFQGRTLQGQVQRLGANVVDRVGVQVRLGMAREESIDDIVRRVRGRRAGKGFVGGVMQATTREAEALVRTAVTYTSNRSILDTLRANKDVLDGVRYVATLDDRTTEICLSLDGTVWELDDPDIVVPGEATHFKCRSVLVGEVAWERLGLTPPPAVDRVVRDMSTVSDEALDRSVRARRRRGEFGDVTRIPSNQTATAWLRGQRLTVQNRLLGRGKADLFRAGKLSLKDLVTSDFRTVSLKELVDG